MSPGVFTSRANVFSPPYVFGWLIRRRWINTMNSSKTSHILLTHHEFSKQSTQWNNLIILYNSLFLLLSVNISEHLRDIIKMVLKPAYRITTKGKVHAGPTDLFLKDGGKDSVKEQYFKVIRVSFIFCIQQHTLCLV